MGERALITGITGQDGAYLAKLLIDKGVHVTGMVRRTSYFHTDNLEYLGVDAREIDLVCGDMTDVASLYRAVEKSEPDYIFNLAAQSFVRASFDCAASTFDINATGVINLLEATKHVAPQAKFYQASTSEMFGHVNCEAQDETTPLHARSPYAIAKIAAHSTVEQYRDAYGLHASCGILFNHESPIRGLEFVTRKITDGVAKIVSGKTRTLSLGNLTAKRDWGFAGDYVEAMYQMTQMATPDDYVIATGVAHSVEHLVDHTFKLVGLDWREYVNTDADAFRPTDVPLLCGDASKARDKLGWQATTSFEDLIEKMLRADLIRHDSIIPEIIRHA